ncbi:MAG: HD domain-containing protein, partial [Deltaproteobacteria bacterium]|nr:HD domain-containing protein [Deltaproteobacteria bacterium]
KTHVKDVISYVDGLTESTSTEALSAIVSLKASDQTYAHCVDVAVIFQTSYLDILKTTNRKSIFQSEKEAMLSSFMHDFGKSKVPKDILDSTVRFERDSTEFKMIQSHPVMGAELLNDMGLPDYIVNMAHYHHVKMDTEMKSSYPQSVDYSNVLKETKLLAIIDVYQALIGKRSYKKSWTPPAAIRYLDALAGVEFDLETWDEFYNAMGLYPISSLVKLNDGSLAFVLNVPKDDIERPQVAVVRNANGQDLTRHELVDLSEEKDVNIDKDVDHQEVFPDGLEIFMNLNLT